MHEQGFYVIGAGVHIICNVYYVCGQKNLNRTLVIDSTFLID